MKVELQPEAGTLSVTDRISLPSATRHLSFLLHAGLKPVLSTELSSLTVDGEEQGPVPLQRYSVTFSSPTSVFSLRYQGTLAHPLSFGGEQGSSRQQTPGLISASGVFLAGSSYWYPQIGYRPVNFRMQVKLPAEWRSVSQGAPLAGRTGWQEYQPQEEIYLIAAPYFHYQQQQGELLTEVYLREADAALADTYLKATARYLALYEKLLGDYPYAKFALVENFWETGYGMPSFTLLGSRVIRLPFIVHTSYPHEIVHNWWGNGVYPDPASSNWSEGLTTYLADHLLQELQGRGGAYRRRTLQHYASYVTDQDDFPLREFRANHGQISQSVGYGKTLMLFHMLRTRLGNSQFREGLRQFYRRYRFQQAGYPELRQVFEAVSGESLEGFFKQWLNRSGAPALLIASTNVSEQADGYRLRITLEQTQTAPPFELTVPLFLQVEGSEQVELHRLMMNNRQATLEIDSAKRPLRIFVDPRYDLFRQLDPGEIPSSLGQLFGAKELSAILPSAADEQRKRAYRRMVEAWQERQPGLRWQWDSEVDELPASGPVWILGKQNRYAPLFAGLLQQQGLSMETGTLVVTRNADQGSGQTLGLIQTDMPTALRGLARKLPHYGRYGYALFSGTEPQIAQRGEWPTTDSALSVELQPTAEYPLPAIPAHTPLVEE